MKIDKLEIKSCCGNKSLILKIDKPITHNFLNLLIANGFKEQQHFTKAGILYADNQEMIIISPLGSNRIQIKCKKNNCEEKISDLEKLLDNA